MTQVHPRFKGIIIPLASLLAFLLIGFNAFSQTQTFSTPGATTFTVPAGVTSITVQVWGGGGRGGSRTTAGEGGGAGGGGFSKKTFSVNPGDIYNLSVGGGSTTGTSPGGDSWFVNNTTLLARGGNSVADNATAGATGGAVGIGDVTYSGGNGFSAASMATGGGGSSAGTASNGTNATSASGAVAPAGGGNGGNGATSNNNPGIAGSFPGGGGGGADKAGSANQVGGNGGNGQVTVSWCSTISAVLSGFAGTGGT